MLGSRERLLNCSVLSLMLWVPWIFPEASCRNYNIIIILVMLSVEYRHNHTFCFCTWENHLASCCGSFRYRQWVISCTYSKKSHSQTVERAFSYRTLWKPYGIDPNSLELSTLKLKIMEITNPGSIATTSDHTRRATKDKQFKSRVKGLNDWSHLSNVQ